VFGNERPLYFRIEERAMGVFLLSHLFLFFSSQRKARISFPFSGERPPPLRSLVWEKFTLLHFFFLATQKVGARGVMWVFPLPSWSLEVSMVGKKLHVSSWKPE